jgi:signal transduction histidine kinase
MRMEHLIGDLMDMVSLRANRLWFEIRSISLIPLIDEASDVYQPVAQQEGITLNRNINIASDLKVRGDHNRLIQVLSNLLGNAIKFSATGDSVTLNAQQKDGEVVISVADTGPGIPPAFMSRIFEPYQTAGGDAQSGTGLGLYIAKSIVQAHGGRIWVESEPSSRTTFFFTIPVA